MTIKIRSTKELFYYVASVTDWKRDIAMNAKRENAQG